ncbi:glycoside hydrolase family 30 beta sandwich domain-containing protein [Dysgonomonas sp. 511]|uniref:glycoside hydrolase family 30 protein n=1 Tax=Dysgonomonas sp. 511 TaxID=2302930 RepID=UPI0013D02D4D|nr:glycoside hydrolase family 30 beta sandwich domain-containing protein [Dysgonomonas sp. 511]NDV78598.1 glucosylceramidase [Dysgonomonas sp. 511]
MKKLLLTSICCLTLLSCSRKENYAELYITTADKTMTMQKDSAILISKSDIKTTENVITLFPGEKYQEMDGFGAAITGSSSYNLLKMAPENRTAILKETFDPKDGYGYSYIRISIGASDFSLDEYTYCDKPGIENFALHEYDKRDLLPILKEIKAINPDVKIMGSPWSCPKWMKVDNLKNLKPFDSWTSGQLNPKYYQDYAAYFVKYIQAMEAEGFHIDAVTIQNEPLNRGNSMSLYMTWQEQRDFVKEALGPAFEKAGIKTKIVVYDHNYNYDDNKPENHDQGQYPLKIYEDADAAKYIDGAAYHAYGGDKSELLAIHNARPDKNLYFTEMSIGLWGEGYSFGRDLMWNMKEVCIGTINNYNKAVIMWNYMLDDKHGPDRPGGCDICLGCITIDSEDYITMDKNSHYYTMAHLSKVVKPGSHRIKSESSATGGIYHSAFQNPDKSLSVVLVNETSAQTPITIQEGEVAFTYNVPAKSVISFIFGDDPEP